MVHVLQEVHQDGEYTLCGVAVEEWDTPDSGYKAMRTHPKRKVVTCLQCAKIIDSLRGMRTAPKDERIDLPTTHQ